MHATFRFQGLGKASLFGVTSAAVHGVAALAFTSLPSPPVPVAPTASLVWLATSAEGAGHDERGAVGPASTNVVPRAASRPRAQRKQAKREAMEPASSERLPAIEGDVASAHPSAPASTPDTTEGVAGDAAEQPAGGGGGSAATAIAGGESGTGQGQGLAHGPGLIADGAPCKGYFPAQARADEGEVRIEVTVDESGHARATTVLAEIPRDNGFGVAASACANHLHFDPAMDHGGARVAGRAKLLLRFRPGETPASMPPVEEETCVRPGSRPRGCPSCEPGCSASRSSPVRAGAGRSR